ncbi:MAG: hypothetical protein OXE99_06730, partial [Cellvibrionales bacterium]|nr:hypothetical protein [Cellvibrionales bacterium]
SDLIKAFKKIEVSNNGSLVIYDDIQKIEDVNTYTHSPGEVEFIFVVKNGDGSTRKEINRKLIILKDEPKEETTELPNEQQKPVPTPDLPDLPVLKPIISDVVFNNETNTYHWNTTHTGQITITQNGNLIDAIPVIAKTWVLSTPAEGWNQVTFSQGDLSVSHGFSFTKKSEENPPTSPDSSPIITNLIYSPTTQQYTWETTRTGNLSIALNGNLVASVPITNLSWVLPHREEGWNQLTFSQGNLSVSHGFSYTIPKEPTPKEPTPKEPTPKPEPEPAPIITNLLYDIGTRKFTWKTTYTGDLDISLNGKQLDTISITDQSWVLTAPDSGRNKLVFSQGNLSEVYEFNFSRSFTKEVIGAMSYAGKRWTFDIFFNDNTFFGYNVQSKTSSNFSNVSDHYPWGLGDNAKISAMIQIDNQSETMHIFTEGGEKQFAFGQEGFDIYWGVENSREPAILSYAPKLSAACLKEDNSSNAYFFFNDGTYLVYKQNDKSITQSIKSSEEDWDLGIYAKDVTACARIHNSYDYLVFLKGGKVAKINTLTKKMKDGFPKLIEEFFNVD